MEKIAAKITKCSIQKSATNAFYVQMIIDIGQIINLSIDKEDWKDSDLFSSLMTFFNVLSFEEITGKYCYVYEDFGIVQEFEQFPCDGSLKIKWKHQEKGIDSGYILTSNYETTPQEEIIDVAFTENEVKEVKTSCNKKLKKVLKINPSISKSILSVLKKLKLGTDKKGIKYSQICGILCNCSDDKVLLKHLKQLVKDGKVVSIGNTRARRYVIAKLANKLVVECLN